MEKILSEKRVKQRNGRKKILYLVKWEGFDEQTWEPASHLRNCKEKLELFRKENNDDEKDGEDEVGAEDEEEKQDGSADESVDKVQEDEEDEEDGEDGEQDEEHKEDDVSEADGDSDHGNSFLNSDESGEDDDGDDDGNEEEIVVERGSDVELDEEEEALWSDTIAGKNSNLKSEFLRRMSIGGFLPCYYGQDSNSSYTPHNVYDGTPTLSDDAFDAASTMQPIDLLFFFMPKTLWKTVARESNRYEMQTRKERIRLMGIRLRQQFSREEAAKKYAEQQRQIVSFESILPHEILIMMGLLIARSLCPMKTGLEHHWSNFQRGAVPSGTWSRYMPRQRFRSISRFMHFTDNNHPMAKKDRAWKIRSVVDTLQETFMRGLTMGRWIAFDEMVIPSKSSRNAIRIYLKNKPHKFGTKLFAVCCGETSYCSRIEVYCGSRQDPNVLDNMCGPAAVIRNLNAIFPNSKIDRSQMRVVVTDREYTSVALAVRLRAMGFSSIGTVQTSRLGFPKELKYPFKTIPKRMSTQRGLCRLRRSTDFPDLFACSWLDNKPVYFLSCGVTTQKTSMIRKEKSGSSSDVPCPEFVASYNKYMNGVDAHDQLRLQRYSVQRSLRFKKYYKTLFFGLFDMALVNAYIVHCEYCKSTSTKPMSHAKFRLLLHEQLIKLSSMDFNLPSPVIISSNGETCASRGSVTTHHLDKMDDKQPCGKVRYRVCKVCSVLHRDDPKKINKTRAYCVECSTDNSPLFLCDRIRGVEQDNQLTCFQIWHQLWKNGTNFQGNEKIRRRSVGPQTESRS